MSGARVPLHARNHRVGGSDPIEFPSSSSSLQYAVSGINGYYSVPSGSQTYIGLDSGALDTNASDVFTIEPNSGLGIDGLGIHAGGCYRAEWTVNFQDVFGHRVTAPETYVCEASDGSTEVQIIVPVLGSYYGRGYSDLSSHGIWDVSWSSVFVIETETAVDDPVILAVNQSTGETLHAYTNLFVVKLSDDLFGL